MGNSVFLLWSVGIAAYCGQIKCMCCKPVVYKYVPDVILFSLTCKQLLRLQYFLTKYHDILFFNSPSHKCASTPESASKNTS